MTSSALDYTECTLTFLIKMPAWKILLAQTFRGKIRVSHLEDPWITSRLFCLSPVGVHVIHSEAEISWNLQYKSCINFVKIKLYHSL